MLEFTGGVCVCQWSSLGMVTLPTLKGTQGLVASFSSLLAWPQAPSSDTQYIQARPGFDSPLAVIYLRKIAQSCLKVRVFLEGSSTSEPFLPVGPIPHTLKFIKNAVIFIEGAQLAAEVVMDLGGNIKKSSHHLESEHSCQLLLFCHELFISVYLCLESAGSVGRTGPS